jgi:hypothetical protein
MERLFADLHSCLIRLKIYEGSGVSADLRSILDKIVHQAVEILVLGSQMIKEGRLGLPPPFFTLLPLT